MTLTTTGLSSLTCQGQYAFSQELVCAGRITGMDITESGGVITVTAGSAYVKVQDADGTEFMVKVYLDVDTLLTTAVSSDVVIKVPQANAEQGGNNLDLTNIATLEVVPTGTGGDYHVVLATIDASSVVSSTINSGIYLPGCNFCMRCEGGNLLLPSVSGSTATFTDVTLNDVTANNITAGNINISGIFTGDASGLTNVPTSGLAYATTSASGVVELATKAEYKAGTPTNRVPTVAQVKASYIVMPGDTNTLYANAPEELKTIDNISDVFFSHTFTATCDGKYRIEFDAKSTDLSDNPYFTYYLNGVQATPLPTDLMVGYLSTNFINGSYQTFTFEKFLNAGDVYTFYGKVAGSGTATMGIQNFIVTYDKFYLCCD